MAGSVSERQVERLTQQLGHEMFDRISGSHPWPIQVAWWEDLLLQQCMRNEWLKVEAFRFIDALPMILDSPLEVARHLKEYFVPPEPRANGRSHHAPVHASARAALVELEPRGGQAVVRLISRLMNFRRLDTPLARFLAWFAGKAALTMAGRFIAGATIAQAERAIRRLRAQRMGFTIDVLGEAALSRTECQAYYDTYMQLIRELPQRAANWPAVALVDEADGRALPRVNVSVKLTSLNSGFDALAADVSKQRTKELLRPLLREALANGAHVHIDIEHYAIKDLTLELCRELFMEPEFRDYPHFGIVLQLYLKDGDRDVADMIAWARQRGTPIWIRLVKGAYWDTETVLAAREHWPCPVWEQKWQSDACYERATRRVLENYQYVHGAFASHNIRTLAHAIALRRLLDVPGWAFELQMLYGMGDPIKRAAVEMGQRCRIYTPYGDLIPGMAYFIRRLLENTANESFLANTSNDETPREELLRDPNEIGRQTPPYEPPLLVRFELEEPLMDPFENVPKTDFTHEPNRREMLAGIAQVRAGLGRDYPLLIAGQRVTTGQWLESLNPARPSEVIGRVAVADGPALDRAVQAAAAAFRTWRHVAPAARAAALVRFGDLLHENRFELAGLIVLECAKTWREADAEVSDAIDFCHFYAQEISRLADHARRRDVPGETNEYGYVPRGVTGVLSRWNFPLAHPVGVVAAAIVTGNTVVLKPASAACVLGARLVELAAQAELPPGVLNLVAGEGAALGAQLVTHPLVETIAFSGARAVGEQINQLAAAHPSARPAFKRVVAQLGGNSGVIIDSDAEMGEALKGVIESGFSYAGQKCSACARVIVLDPIYDRFVERLVDACRGIRVGPAEEPTTGVPPVIDAAAYEAVRRLIDEAGREATVALTVDVSEVARKYPGGYFVGPTIFTDVPAGSRLGREKAFGPIVAVLRARDLDHALELFNDSDYALAGGIYSRSPAHIERARRDCECGNFFINRKITGALVDLQPCGGFKMSGIGRQAGGPDYLAQFCDTRTVTENTLRRGFAPSDELTELIAHS